MLINNGRHPFTNKTIVPEEVVKHAAYGRSVSNGEPEFAETVGLSSKTSLEQL